MLLYLPSTVKMYSTFACMYRVQNCPTVFERLLLKSSNTVTTFLSHSHDLPNRLLLGNTPYTSVVKTNRPFV